jgi:hypothetical protein
MKTTEIYNDFMARFGIEHGMFSVIENMPSRFASVSLYRNQSSPEFETSGLGLETLRFLAPHCNALSSYIYNSGVSKPVTDRTEDGRK